MLTEIEKYSGLVFLATNLAHEIDEAMHRRITCVIEYRSPDHTMRRRIWENLLGLQQTSQTSSSTSSGIFITMVYKIIATMTCCNREVEYIQTV